ncbi:MAG: PAS domain-containing protein [Acetobacteraceae bacterium]|nr:PAS domain-containing protein [Acetobacteraceae bacterium]
MTALVWIASLWLAAPPPATVGEPAADGLQLTHGGLRDLVEHSAVPMLVVHGERIIIANAAARETLGEHVIGQDARVALRHPLAVELLSRRDGGSATIHGLTGPRSSWQMSRQPVDERYSVVELINRTAEADVSRAHTDFVANASHELRTPLASIIGYVETLAEDGVAVEPARAARFHATVLREARRLQTLVDDLMSLSRVEAEKHDQPREQLDLALLVRQASRDGAGADRLERIAFELPDQRIMVRGDRQQLEQLVRNLIDNALKYGQPDGQVTVAIRPEDSDAAVLTVRDEGDGIPAEHIPHLTRRFYRTDPGRSRAAGGTGLGLAIVKHIVERHRGRLEISSAPGRGTTVAVHLPQAD